MKTNRSLLVELNHVHFSTNWETNHTELSFRLVESKTFSYLIEIFSLATITTFLHLHSLGPVC